MNDNVKATIIHVKHFMVRCLNCSNDREQVVMTRQSGPVGSMPKYMCQRCCTEHVLTYEEMELATQDRQPTGVDKRREVTE